MNLSDQEKSEVKGGIVTLPVQICNALSSGPGCPPPPPPPPNTEWNECSSMMNTEISCCAP